MKPLMSVLGLSKRFGRDFELGPVDFSLFPGEVLALLGPNGAGKTTCLRMVAGLLSPDGGGIDLSGVSCPERMKLGYMSEELSFWPDLSCRAQIEFAAGLYGLDSLAGLRLCDCLELSGFLDCQAARLSLGNRRKLSLVLSAVHEPPVLILDEPFNGLDAGARRKASRWIRERCSKQEAGTAGSVLLSSHQLEEIEACADRVLFIKNGLIAAEWLPESGGTGLRSVYHGLFDCGDCE